MKLRRVVPLALACFVAGTVTFREEPTAAKTRERVLTPNCPNAVPSDGVDDADEIQTCLDNGTDVILEPGIYDIEDKIRFRSDDLLLTSEGGKATLRARPWLEDTILQVQGANYYEISELILDGNRANRYSGSLSNACGGSYPGQYGSNFHFQGEGWWIHHIDTINAACGSGMEGTGEYFYLYSIYAADNGQEQANSSDNHFRWADGITVNRCTSGSITNNYALNNTDVGIVVARGSDCTVRYNLIENDSRYAFAGLGIGAEVVSGGSGFAGSTTSDNEITSGYNLMSYGIAVGLHPWNTSVSGGDAGEIRYNTVTGAVHNLMVDGISDGTITNNTLSSAQGNRYFTSCSFGGNVTYGDKGSATVQSGTCMIMHGGCGCQ